MKHSKGFRWNMLMSLIIFTFHPRPLFLLFSSTGASTLRTTPQHNCGLALTAATGVSTTVLQGGRAGEQHRKPGFSPLSFRGQNTKEKPKRKEGE